MRQNATLCTLCLAGYVPVVDICKDPDEMIFDDLQVRRKCGKTAENDIPEISKQKFNHSEHKKNTISGDL